MKNDNEDAVNIEPTDFRDEFAGIDASDISYDYFKSMVSLSVLALGGIVGLAESLFGDRITTTQLLLVAGLMAASGIVALQCQSDIVQVARGKKTPTYWLRWGHRIVPALFGGGIGGFFVLMLGVF